ncbi:MAG: autotransporter domain-containing protein [Sphingomonadaceae bacterium]|nr:autotransporter domain-containing protein [Sphingomonadaceae bacterium]
MRIAKPVASTLRSALLVSSALLLVFGAEAAYASTDDTDSTEAEAGDDDSSGRPVFAPVLAPHAAVTIPSAATVPQQQRGPITIAAPEPEILVANPGTPTTARDPVNITGIGQMFINNGNGTIGLCTGTLINPRTVLFAAHCVNSRASTAYGAGSGGTPIAFGFETNTRANAAGQPDELLNWFNGGSTGPGQNRTNVAQALYNVNQVVYNDFSLEPAARSFLYGDVALATLDTPAANVPTWSLLFSPLPNPGTIGASGTGYNVGIVGYGNNGTGITGAAGIDFRRRAAENMIGALTDLQTFEQFLFGGAPNGLTQNLYFIDFDDPRRGISPASPFDFNAFRDNARFKDGFPTEGITSSGDSGGPLILQNFAKQLVVGVLSGGYTRFFNGQPANGYGTVAFYQPLYLYWDWIVANNPYRYVSAKAGDGAWTDASRWVTTLDPAYTILSGGQPVNGLPTAPGEQKNGTGGDFGQACFQNSTVSECLDLATNTVSITSNPIGTAGNNSATVTIARDSAATADLGLPELGLADGVVEAQAVGPVPLPTATIANGLPGATNFVPNNIDPVRATGTLGRYFDVTLANAGTTTLSGANIVIDRLTIGTAAAGLRIDAGASLTTLINTTQFAGTNTINGTLTSVGDYSLLGGVLLGSGRINAPFLTSVLGQIAPGTATTTGTLTIGGNLVLASGNTYFVNIGSGQSDLISVVANGAGTGSASLGGGLNVSLSTGSTIRFGDVYTILTASNGYTGTFSSTNALSAILRPTVVYGTNAVQLQITAVPYSTVVNGTSPIQAAYAAMLDGNRTNPALTGIFNVLDLQDTATIRTTLEALAPRTETLRWALGRAGIESANRLIRNRLLALNPGVSGGSIAYLGNPMRTASVAYAMGRTTMTPAMAAAGAADTRVREGKLPDNVSAFFAGGYLDGDSAPMPTALPAGGRDQFNGWYIGAGAEVHTGDNGAVGLAVSYTDLTGKAVGGLGSADGSLIQGSLYAKVQLGRIAIDGQFSAGVLSMNTSRSGALPATPYTLTSSDDALALSGEVNISAMFGSSSLQFGPSAGLRWSRLDFGRIVERGGPTALVIDQENHRAFEGRAGFNLMGTGRVRPTASVHYVHAFRDQPTFFNGFFVGGAPTTFRSFAVAGSDRNWADASLGLAFKAGKADIAVSADTTLARSDFDYQTYRASISFKF